MIHVTALAGAIIWLGLNGLLWYTRPSDLLSLLGSSILGAIFFRGGMIGGYAYRWLSEEPAHSRLYS